MIDKIAELALRTRWGEKNIADRFTAGTTVAEGFARAEELRKQGFKVTLSWLGGEHNSGGVRVLSSVIAHKQILNKTIKEKLDYEIAIKLSAWGLFNPAGRSDYQYLRKELEKFVKKAELYDIFIWVDAEELAFRKKTRSVFSSG